MISSKNNYNYNENQEKIIYVPILIDKWQAEMALTEEGMTFALHSHALVGLEMTA